MRKTLLLLIFLFGCFSFFQSAQAAGNYYYDLIEVDIWINKDSTFNVVEKMTCNLDGNFGYFYRDIELKDLDHLSDVEVFDSQGNKLSKNQYDFGYKGNRLHLQWNFPRRDFKNELKSWVVKYKVHGGLGFFNDYDELFWNAIFQDRDVIVKKAEILVHLAQEVDNIKPRLFIGSSGDKTGSYNYQVIDRKTIKFWGEYINPGQYLTVVVAWPKGIVEKPIIYRDQLIALIVLLISFIVPIVVFAKAFKDWQKKGRDVKIEKTIIAQYEPPDNLAPALTGVLIRQSVNIKDILATVINLAVRGYLRIREQENKFLFVKEKEYIFEKLKPEADLKPFEQETMKSIFRHKDIVSSKDLKNKFYKELPVIKKEIYKEMAQTDLFNGNIEKIRKKYSLIYIIIFSSIIFLILLAGLSIRFLSLPLILWTSAIIIAVSMAFSSAIGLIFARFMPVLTNQGAGAKWRALGFKEYLHTAERFRIEAETLGTFSNFLPYAMVFGVEKQWAKRFDDFQYQEQGWYYPAAVYGGPAGAPTSFSEFSSSFSSFASSVSSLFVSSPDGSGAGGGAGGGGGGGGGGAG
jgi:uncharacterized membrane protein (DUF485 family)